MMYKKLHKFIFLPCILLCLLFSSLFFVACKNENNNTNSTTDSIPDSNVYEDLVNYVKSNSQSDTEGNYPYYIIGNNTAPNYIALVYMKEGNLALFTINRAIGGFRLIFPTISDYSKAQYLITVAHKFEFESKFTNYHINLPATKYVDMNTTTKLTDIATFVTTPPLTEEQKIQMLTQISPIFSQGLTEFSNFYASTIKKDNKYLGATYKYFYLPVIK